jgi:hypothetical protein
MEYLVNSIRREEIEVFPCPVCEVKLGPCVQVGTPLRMVRSDWHSERKQAFLEEQWANKQKQEAQKEMLHEEAPSPITHGANPPVLEEPEKEDD